MRQSASIAILALVVSTALVGQCPQQGLALYFQGERLGDPFACGVFGNPGAGGLLGVDDTGGPTPTQYGNVCLGLSPALQLIPFNFDPLGQFWISGTLAAYPPLIGFTAYLQAAAVDAGQPNGIALSNGRKVKLRPPRIYFIDPGYASPFGTVNGRWVGFDALTDTSYTTAINLPSSVLDAVLAPDQGWLVLLLGNGTIQCYDTSTAALALSFQALTSPGYPSKLAIDGSALYVLHYGTAPSPFGGGSPGGVRSYTLPTGAPGISVFLPTGNPDAMIAFPGTGIAYLRTGTSVTPVDVAGGNAYPPIVLSSTGASGGISEWVLANGILYCLFPGSGPGLFNTPTPVLMNGINTATATPLFPDAVNLNVNGAATMLRYGPGSGGGNTLFVYNPSYALPLLQVNPSTLIVTTPIAVSTGLSEMTLSPGGTEWLMLCTGAVCNGPQLQTLVPPLMGVNNISPLIYPMTLMISLPSTTMRRAFTLHNGNTVVPFSTDSTGLPITAIPLPISSGNMRYVVD